jgi:hypothetical protein
MAVRMERTPAFPISKLPGIIPICKIDDNVDPLPIAQASLIYLQLMDSVLLTKDTLWRDLFALTGTTRTLNGVDRIQSAWKELCTLHQPHEFRLPEGVTITRPTPTLSWIQAKFSFRAGGRPKMVCTGIMRLITDERQNWKIWTLVTVLQGIEGIPNVDVLEPAMGWESYELPTPVSDRGAVRLVYCWVPQSCQHQCSDTRTEFKVGQNDTSCLRYKPREHAINYNLSRSGVRNIPTISPYLTLTRDIRSMSRCTV